MGRRERSTSPGLNPFPALTNTPLPRVLVCRISRPEEGEKWPVGRVKGEMSSGVACAVRVGVGIGVDWEVGVGGEETDAGGGDKDAAAPDADVDVLDSTAAADLSGRADRRSSSASETDFPLLPPALLLVEADVPLPVMRSMISSIKGVPFSGSPSSSSASWCPSSWSTSSFT